MKTGHLENRPPGKQLFQQNNSSLNHKFIHEPQKKATLMRHFTKPTIETDGWMLSPDSVFRGDDERTEQAIFCIPPIPNAEPETGDIHFDHLDGQILMGCTQADDFCWVHWELLKINQHFLIRKTAYEEGNMSSFDYEKQTVSTCLYLIPRAEGLALESTDLLVLRGFFERYVTNPYAATRPSWRKLSMSVST